MISLTLISLAVLWIVALRRYPALFVPRQPNRLTPARHHLDGFWIDVMPTAHHREVEMQEVA